MFRMKIMLWLLVVLSSASVCAQGAGAVTGVYRDGVAVYSKAFGLADVEQNVALTSKTPMHVASVSKQFAAFAIALLARDGKLNLDADIRTYLPWAPDFGQPITVRQLVHHTSGLRDQLELAYTRGITREDILRQAHVINLVSHQRSLNFPPGTEYSYGNTGYTLLAEIVRAVSGKTLRAFTTERIFQPLGMTHTFFNDDITQIVPGRAQSYRRAGEGAPWRWVPLNFETVGSTNVITTLDDLSKWADNFFRPVVGDAKLIEQVITPGLLASGKTTDYAFGLERRHIAGHEAVMHSGYDAGFRAVIALFPDQRVAVILLRNDSGLLDDPLAELANTYLNAGKKLPSLTPAAIAPSRAVLGKAPGHYLSRFDKAVTIQLVGKQLVWQTAWSSPTPIVFRSDGTFDLGDNDRIWSSYRLIANGLERISTDGGGLITTYQRVDAVKLSDKDLASVTGDYRSSELDVTYTFSVEGGRLVGRSIGLAKTLTFTPATKDRFDSDGYEMGAIEFDRDAQRRVTGMRAHVGNSRNISFVRVADPDSRN